MCDRRERGVVAVEFALVLPVVVVLLFGIIEFGRAYNASITVTHAARETVRKIALRSPLAEAKQAGIDATASLPGVPTFPPPTECTAGVTNAVVTMKYAFRYDIPFFKSNATIDMSKTATMLCGG